MEPSDPPPVPMPEVDLEQLEKLKKETFRGLMSQRTWILEDHAHDLKKLDDERDQRLRDNYAKMVSLGIPEEELPLPPENSEKKAARLAEKVMFRKLKEEEIKRVLREVPTTSHDLSSHSLLPACSRRFGCISNRERSVTCQRLWSRPNDGFKLL